MDFHFYSSPNTASSGPVKPKRLLLSFLPLFLLAALLPASLFLVQKPVTDKFNSQAAQNSLSVWFEPANVITSVGKPVTLTVFARFDSDKLLPGVKFPITAKGDASIENPQVNSIVPFTGQVQLGTVKINPFRVGDVIVSVDPKEIVSPLFTETFETSVSAAKIVVR